MKTFRDFVAEEKARWKAAQGTAEEARILNEQVAAERSAYEEAEALHKCVRAISTALDAAFDDELDEKLLADALRYIADQLEE